MSRFRQKSPPLEVKDWPVVNCVKKPEILSKMVLGAHFRTFCSQRQIVPNKDTYL